MASKKCKLLWIGIILLTTIHAGWMFSTGPPDDVHWLVVDKNKPEKNTCSRMDPSIAGTHEGGKQYTSIPYKLTVDKESVNSGEVVNIDIVKVSGSSSNESLHYENVMKGKCFFALLLFCEISAMSSTM